MSTITYGPGGYRSEHPTQGVVELFDDATSTVTRWDDKGQVIETRPYTRAEADAAAKAEDAANSVDVEAEVVALREALVEKAVVTREEIAAKKPTAIEDAPVKATRTKKAAAK